MMSLLICIVMFVVVIHPALEKVAQDTDTSTQPTYYTTIPQLGNARRLDNALTVI